MATPRQRTSGASTTTSTMLSDSQTCTPGRSSRPISSSTSTVKKLAQLGVKAIPSTPPTTSGVRAGGARITSTPRTVSSRVVSDSATKGTVRPAGRIVSGSSATSTSASGRTGDDGRATLARSTNRPPSTTPITPKPPLRTAASTPKQALAPPPTSARRHPPSTPSSSTPGRYGPSHPPATTSFIRPLHSGPPSRPPSSTASRLPALSAAGKRAAPVPESEFVEKRTTLAARRAPPDTVSGKSRTIGRAASGSGLRANASAVASTSAGPLPSRRSSTLGTGTSTRTSENYTPRRNSSSAKPTPTLATVRRLPPSTLGASTRSNLAASSSGSSIPVSKRSIPPLGAPGTTLRPNRTLPPSAALVERTTKIAKKAPTPPRPTPTPPTSISETFPSNIANSIGENSTELDKSWETEEAESRRASLAPPLPSSDYSFSTPDRLPNRTSISYLSPNSHELSLEFLQTPPFAHTTPSALTSTILSKTRTNLLKNAVGGDTKGRQSRDSASLEDLVRMGLNRPGLGVGMETEGGVVGKEEWLIDEGVSLDMRKDLDGKGGSPWRDSMIPAMMSRSGNGSGSGILGSSFSHEREMRLANLERELEELRGKEETMGLALEEAVRGEMVKDAEAEALRTELGRYRDETEKMVAKLERQVLHLEGDLAESRTASGDIDECYGKLVGVERDFEMNRKEWEGLESTIRDEKEVLRLQKEMVSVLMGTFAGL